jgi:hypothetical protein
MQLDALDVGLIAGYPCMPSGNMGTGDFWLVVKRPDKRSNREVLPFATLSVRMTSRGKREVLRCAQDDNVSTTLGSG